ncbi:hypothetical protein SAMD00023353_2000600 [Rosellinia necatrix]|uniref:Uncharacterized protein n=1 Tax=Rosellinia necatrix TaxID=77044 RepID=A0A1W2TF50_ROSNE|nr:hypothetical protein SAMD00023353_2000600 [Rosellinia necatrix]
MVASPRSRRRLLIATFVATALFLFFALRTPDALTGQLARPRPNPNPSRPGQTIDDDDDDVRSSSNKNDDSGKKNAAAAAAAAEDRELELVVASVKAENTSWFDTYLPEWHKNVYVADDPGAALTVPRNKGREAMVYLTYLIERYDSLPAAVVFVHASRFAWHNDDPDYDALPALRRLRLPYLRREGYVNLRCVWVIGCPGEIRPAIDAAADKPEVVTARHVYKQAFEELLPDVPLPDLVAVSCCSQFAVTRDAVRRRPRADYVRYRDWLLATPLDDALNGRVFEFAWHIIFGKEAVHCPPAASCYCNVFGLCDLEPSCRDDSSCDGRYVLPPFSSLPKGWPLVGWQHEERNFTGPL